MVELKSLTDLCIQRCRSLKQCPSHLNVVVLNLTCCCSIQSLPRGLFNLKQLALSPCSNPGQEMLANLKYLRCLHHLKFQECPCCRSYVRELPGYLGKLSQLSVLDIQDTRIKCLPSSITDLSKLRSLLLPSVFILETLSYQLDESLVISVEETHVRKTWKELKKEMEIFSSPLVTVDPSGYLHLTGDPTPWILEYYASHSTVRILDLQYSFPAAVNIEDSIPELGELSHLCITNGFFTRLPLLPIGITHLSLYDCEFMFFMESSLDSLGKLSALESLRIGLCDTKFLHQIDLPVSLRQLTLCLRKHPAPLPDSMNKLSNLKALHLYGNGIQFDSLPEILNLDKLKLVDCYIKSLPTGLRHVEILHSQGTCLHDCNGLGNCFNQLVNVETLSVTCHCIKFLPSVAGLHNLQELQLKDCFRIKELPPNLDAVVNLRTLNVSGTRIKSLPCSISTLPKLQHLILPRCFPHENLPLEFRDQSVFDDTNDTYYKDMGYYDYNHETSGEDDDSTTNTIEGDNKVVSEDSEEGIISQQDISPRQLLNQPDPTPVVGDSHGSEANHAIGENSHHTFLSYQNLETEILCFESEPLTADIRPLNVKNACFPSSQHSSQPEHMASMTSEIEHGLPPNLQLDSSSGTGNNLPVSENGQNEDNVHREGFGKNSQHTVQDGQMDLTNSETEHEITLLNQDNSSCSQRDVSHSENNLNAIENNQIENNSENESQKGKRKRNEITLEEIESQFGKKEKHAAIELGVSLSTMKRRCRELGIEEWPSSRHHSSNSEHSHLNMVDAIGNSTPNATTKSVKDATVATQSHTNELAPESMNGTRLCTSSTTIQPNGSSSTFVVKAKWNDDIVRFDFSLSSDIDQLKEKISKKLELKFGKFKIKYEDDDGDWVLVTCISDLENALRLSKSAGSDVVKLSVISKT